MKPILKDVSLTQICRVDFGKNCQTSGLLVEKFCPYPKHRFVCLNLLKRINPTRNTKKLTIMRLTKIYNNRSEFSFFYHENASSGLFLELAHESKNNEMLLSNSS